MNHLLIALVIAVWWPIGCRAKMWDYSNTLAATSKALSGFRLFDEVVVDRIEQLMTNKQLRVDDAMSYNITACYDQVQYLLDGLNRTELYALKLFDAWGRPPSGVFSGNVYDFGNFDQCLSYSHLSDRGLIRGQHCSITMRPLNPDAARSIQHPALFETLAPRMMPGMSNADILRMTIGICVPAVCDPAIVKTLLESVLTQFNLTTGSYNQADFCSVQEEVQFNAADWSTIAIFVVVGLLMVTSTIYDVYTKQCQKPQILILKAFSVYTNVKKLFASHKAATSPDHVGCINGIRVLSIVWVVVCHSFLLYTVTPLQNSIDLIQWVTHYSSMVLLNGTLAVDTFFLMSGMLLAMSVMRELDRNRKLNLPVMYLHRYLRLTPALAALILFASTLIRYVWSGPFWKQLQGAVIGSCEKYWWSALLYVQNYVNPTEICLSHSWYLSVDMQLYILSPLILYPLWRFGKKFVAVIVLLIFAAMSCALAIMVVNGFQVGWTTMDKSPNRMKSIYFPTHIRMHAWLVGVLLGYILHLNKRSRFILTKPLIFAGWTSSLVIIFGLIFGAYPLQQLDYPGPFIYDAFYEALSRALWATAVGWIIFACINGYGGWVNSFLSWPVLQPLGKLSYSIYLIHMILQTMFAVAIRHPRYFSNTAIIHSFWGDLGLTLTIAVVWSLAFESPIVVIEKYLFRLFQRPRRPTTPSPMTVTTNTNSQATLTEFQES